MRRLTGRSEISRILNRHEGYSGDLVQAIARSIARSSDKDAVFCKLFDVAEISARLADKKAVSDEDQPRLVWCLEVRDAMMFESDVGGCGTHPVCLALIATVACCAHLLAQSHN